MKTLYFDCFAGCSGDMILGALVGAGVDPHALTEQLQSLGVNGGEIDFDRVDRSGISATHAREQGPYEHAYPHLKDIPKVIYESQVSDGVKNPKGRICSRLAEPE